METSKLYSLLRKSWKKKLASQHRVQELRK